MKFLNIAGLSLICLMGAGTAALADTVYNDFGSSFPKFNANSSSAGYNNGPRETALGSLALLTGGLLGVAGFAGLRGPELSKAV